jgi:pheromone shutdown protein TraB
VGEDGRLDIDDNTEIRVRFFHNLMVEERDRQLLGALDTIVHQHSREDLTVVVAYGAAHMPAVIHYLRERHGYRARTGEWLSVINF